MVVKRKGLVLAPLAALFLAACGASEATMEPSSAAAPAPPVRVTAVAAELRREPATLDVTGTLVADAKTDVAAEVPGRVLEVLVERGQPVAAGQVLARLDPRDAENQLAEAEANVAQTRARLGLEEGQAFDPNATPDVRQQRVALERRRLDFERFEQLLEEGIVSRSEYDLRRTDYLAAKEQLDATVNQMRQLYQTLKSQQAVAAMRRKALADTVIRAPYAGLVAEKQIDVGQYVDRGDRIATIVRIHPLRIELAIPETAVSSVRRGQKVSFAVQTYPDRRFDGTVKYVGPSLDPNSRALVAEAVVPNQDGTLKPGLFATARVELPAMRESVVVPAAAVRTDAGVSRVFVLAGGRADLRVVQVGDRTGDLVEIVRGVEAGERVVTRGLEQVSDGAAVAEVAAAAARVE
ncbi:MAG TPA: efflux RND transporter periplasmic adaptor subunit [Thermodesulfobacteriota bacterium]